MKIERKLFSGVMNLDDPNEVISGTHHREAKNILFKGSPGEMRLEGIPGNQSVANAGLYTTGGATNTCIGSYYDELKQRVFFFVYNSAGRDAIFSFNTNTRAITTLLMSKVDSQVDEDIFSFSPDYPIVSVNILYRTESDGDILCWTDRNQRPMKLNLRDVDTAVNPTKVYGANWKKSYLTVSRPMPLLSPICKYLSEGTIASETVNNLKNKVYQFRYRWVYKDFTKSTWSPWSRLFAPENVDALATEIDPLKNNTISVKYFSGGTDVLKIEIAGRHSIDSVFSDPFLVETVNKAGLFDDNEYEYKFRNNEAYAYVDVAESNQLFDYIPLKANSQELLNGNVLIYGGITEGRTPIDSTGATVSIAATTTLSLVANTVTTANFTATLYPQYTFIYSPSKNYASGHYFYVFDGTPVVGDQYEFEFTLHKDSLGDTVVTIPITVLAGEASVSAIQNKLLTAINSNSDFNNYGLSGGVTLGLSGTDPAFPLKYGIKVGGDPTGFAWQDSGNFFPINYAGGAGLPPDPTGVNNACYKHKSRFSFGICYFDDYGVTNGVMTADALKIITPEIDSADLGGSPLTIPKIEFSVTNRPPLWAKYFSFVRTTNLTVSDFKTIITDLTKKDTVNKFAYLAITKYQENKSGYPAYSFAKGDRVRIIGRKNNPEAIYDYPVLSYVKSVEVTEVVLNPNNLWLKIPYDTTWMSVFDTIHDYYIEVYTPAVSTSEENQVFYEFGETYKTKIDANGNLIHSGTTQDQVIGAGAQPAKFIFIRGDVYSRERDAIDILDKSMSDKYGSKVEGLGRPFVMDEYAKEAYYPTLVRYSLEYQSGTSINQTNRFYAANFDEYDREKGDIQRLKTRGRQLRVFQNRACGVVPILQSVVQTADGNGVLSQSAEIINKIQYYLGEYGVGGQYCSIASSASSDYFSDPVRGCQVRLSGDGITPISELYKAHFYLNPILIKYNKIRTNITNIGKAKILAFYDQFNEEFVTAMQESTGTAPDKTSPLTFGFNEFRNSYTSFYDYSPEWISTAGNLVISWKSGVLYTHDNTSTYCNFYGVQYLPSVTAVFNQYEQIKKRYNTITMLASKVWAPNTNGDITTNLSQNSSLQSTDFIFKDDKIHASFKRDSGSTGGLYNGNVLKGNWAQIKLKPVNGNEFVNLYYIELSILEPFYNR
jgi:hypothetical protein